MISCFFKHLSLSWKDWLCNWSSMCSKVSGMISWSRKLQNRWEIFDRIYSVGKWTFPSPKMSARRIWIDIHRIMHCYRIWTFDCLKDPCDWLGLATEEFLLCDLICICFDIWEEIQEEEVTFTRVDFIIIKNRIEKKFTKMYWLAQYFYCTIPIVWSFL